MVAIWIRSTVDWADEQAFLAQAPADIVSKVELWNATFTLPFHVFRARVREIAAVNHARVVGAEVLDWDAIPDGALVLPVDDDDWFAPDAALRLSAGGCYWTSRWIEVPTRLGHRVHTLRRRTLPWIPPKWVLTTTNYALVKTPDARPLLASHIKASRWLGAGGQLERLDSCLSLTNRTLASRTTLRLDKPSLSRASLLRKYRRHLGLYDKVPPDLPWSRPYVEAMAGLMRELRIRRRPGGSPPTASRTTR